MTGATARLRVFGVVLASVLLAGTLGFSLLEGLSLVDALYFSVVTVATVGYGDIHPITPAGRLLAVALIVCGVGTFLGVVANATDLLLARRQERVRRERLSMVVSLFFSEIGTDLLRLITRMDPERDRLCEERVWQGKKTSAARRLMHDHRWQVHLGPQSLEELRIYLGEKSALLLRMLENQNLLEHESFTDLLRAVFHLKEELLSRPEGAQLPDSDLGHLAGDVRRVYPLLAGQWLSHLEFLEKNYPYLHSLALRTSPFGDGGPPIVVDG
jgi:hypothetical protein